MSLIPRESIAAGFAPKPAADIAPAATGEVDRTAGLANLLPPRPPVLPATRPTEASSAPAQIAAQPLDEDEAPPAPASEGGITIAGVYVLPATLARVRAAKANSKLTYVELLMEAFDHVTDDELRAVFAPLRVSTSPGGMPGRPVRKRREQGLPVNLGLTREQRAWLDAKIEAVGAPSFSALISETYRLYLTRTWPGTGRL